jgi:hypothetical protein
MQQCAAACASSRLRTRPQPQTFNLAAATDIDLPSRPELDKLAYAETPALAVAVDRHRRCRHTLKLNSWICARGSIAPARRIWAEDAGRAAASA